jgi:hypothetical protein
MTVTPLCSKEEQLRRSGGTARCILVTLLKILTARSKKQSLRAPDCAA